MQWNTVRFLPGTAMNALQIVPFQMYLLVLYAAVILQLCIDLLCTLQAPPAHGGGDGSRRVGLLHGRLRTAEGAVGRRRPWGHGGRGHIHQWRSRSRAADVPV